MATFFKKPRRNFRGRQVAPENDSDDNDNSNNVENNETEDTAVSSPKVVKQKKKKKETIERTSSVLSFGDFEDEGETFKVKKSSHSKRIAKQLKKENQKETDKEKTKENEGPVRRGSPVQREDSQEDREEKIRRLREDFLTLNGEDAEAFDSEEEAEDKASISKMMKRGEIPDANMIHLIRKKRQQARDLGDYIPVDDTEKLESSKSRLVRDDDNDKSDDDEEEDSRMDFSVNKHARDRIKMQNEFLAAEHGSDNEDSDNDREWEEQQIRKGVSMGTEVSDLSQSASSMQINQYNGYQSQTTYSSHHTNSTFEPFTTMAVAGQQVSMDAIRKRLKDRLDSMDEVNRRHVNDRDTLVTDIDDTEKSITSCEGNIKGLEERYCFFQEMRGYVRDLVECLNEKVPRINDLEQRMLNLWRNRAQKLLIRRQQDVRDQCQDYMTNKAQVHMETSEAQIRQRRVAEREARRARRRRARESKDIVGHHDGLSSDDEENQSEITKFTVEKDSITGGVERVFEDVMEDFSQVQSVRQRFEDWKYKYGETYKEAYIGLCLPKLYNPYVRLQLIQWNPLEANSRDFEETGWFETLVFYGFKREDTISKQDDDVRLLPTIVEKVLLLKLTTFAETIWDPLSTTQTARLVNTLQKIIKDYPTIHAESKNTQTLLHAIAKRMQKTLDDDVFMPLYPKSVIENRSSGSSVFFHRQLWTCIKLLGNILSWNGILASSVLHGLALDGLLNRYIILGLCNSVLNRETLQKCQSIISTFPKEWFSDLDDDKTVPQLENLAKYLVSAATTIYNQSLSQREPEKKESKEHIRQISKMLVNIHAMEKAANLPY